jgi:hypothetical protein
VRRASRSARPYSGETTLKGKALLEEHGVEVVSHGRLENVTNIYDETQRLNLLLDPAQLRPESQETGTSAACYRAIFDIIMRRERIFRSKRTVHGLALCSYGPQATT